MSTVRENLIAVKDRFMVYRGSSMQASLIGELQGNPLALETLVALREALPDGFRDFRDFESSRAWSRNAALQTFDRAIAAQDEP